MREKRNGMIMAAVVAVLMSGFQAAAQKYEPDWDSLAKHNAEPEWLKDAKLGIYFHWGPYAVPAFSSEWYPRHMYEKNKVKRYHEKNFGPIAVFGYHHFVPTFTGEINSFAMVGLQEPVQWQRTAQGLEITFPAQRPTEWEWAYSFRIR